MIGDYPFLAHKVAREPGERLTSQDAWTCAWAGAKMVETIREYLPVKGMADDRQASWHVQETAAASACNLYRATEVIRNPHEHPFGPGRGTNESYVDWHDGLHTSWEALCESIDRVAEFYDWQDVSTGGKHPSMPCVPDGQKIPGIDSALLDAVETPAETICEICQVEPKNALAEQLERSEAARLDLEQQIAAVVKSQDMLLSLGGDLTPLEYKIVKYLWDRRSASWKDINRDCWDKPVQPDSQMKAIKRLSHQLNELNKGVFIETTSGIVTLTRPDK